MFSVLFGAVYRFFRDWYYDSKDEFIDMKNYDRKVRINGSHV